MDEKTLAKLPQYKCHKIVRASKIITIDKTGTGTESTGIARLILETEGIPPVEVDVAWLNTHKVAAGGYLVVYDDGRYTSWSPAEPFESGYTLLK